MRTARVVLAAVVGGSFVVDARAADAPPLTAGGLQPQHDDDEPSQPDRQRQGERPRPRTSTSTLGGTQWTLDGDGRLIRQDEVIVSVDIDEDAGVVRQQVVPVEPGGAPRTTVFAIDSLRRSGSVVVIAASAPLERGMTLRLALQLVGERSFSQELWVTSAGDIARTRLRVGAPLPPEPPARLGRIDDGARLPAVAVAHR